MSIAEELSEFTKYIQSRAFILSALVFIIASVILYIIKNYLIKKVSYTGKDTQHKNTFIGMIFNLMQYLVIVVAAVLILQAHGVNVTSIFAGLGIVATIVGLALQDTLKDLIAGVNIYNNNFYKVGDMVRYNGEECDVKYFSARVTKFQSIITNSTYTVNNSEIRSIEKIKDSRTLTFMFKFDEDKEKIDAAFKKIVERSSEIKNLKTIFYGGIWDINETGVMYGMFYTCPAHKHLFMRPELVTLAYDEFKKHGVTPIFNLLYDSENRKDVFK